MSLNDTDFNYISGLIKEKSGIFLTKDKMYLLETRLLPLVKEEGFTDLTSLVEKIRTNGSEELIKNVIEAMTTNESSFFRDVKPFDTFRDIVLPRLVEKKPAGEKIKILSAACSNGQEPYSLIITLEENKAKLGGREYEITGCDLDEKVLKKAREGIYTQFEVQRGLPIKLLMSYFTQNGDKWQVNENIRNKVTFKQANLMKDLSSWGTYDVILCRNVLIYFEQETKEKIVQMWQKMVPDYGVLFLGSSESIFGLDTDFASLSGASGVFVKDQEA
jgi:chemotaxis protein methyltransferase CheR